MVGLMPIHLHNGPVDNLLDGAAVDLLGLLC